MPSVNIPSEQIDPNWIENNLKIMMADVMARARRQQSLPLSITMHDVAYRKFINILSSKSMYFPNPDGSLSFLGIPIYINSKLPFGCFTLERVRSGNGMLVR